MNIQISFQKKEFQKGTEDYLCSRLDKDVDQHLINNLRKLTSGDAKKLLANEANDFFPVVICLTIIKRYSIFSHSQKLLA